MRILLAVVIALCLGGCYGTGAFLQGMSQGLSGTYQMNRQRQWQEFNRQQAADRQARAAERQARALEGIRYGY